LHRHLLVALAVLAVAAIGYLVFSGPGAGPAPMGVEPVAKGGDPEDGPAVAELERGGAAADPRRQAVAMEPQAAPAGSEWIVRGRTVDAAGQPVAGAKVQVYGTGRMFRGGPQGPARDTAEGVSGADGVFTATIPALEETTEIQLMVAAAHPTLAPSIQTREVTVEDRVANLGDVVLTGGGSLLGSVTDLQGIGVPRAALTIQPRRGNPLQWTRNRSELLPETAADANGFFRIENLAAGTYRLSAVAPGHERESTRDFEIVEGQQTTLDALALGPGFALRGLVTDASGAPISGASVRLGRSFRARTNQAGEYEVDHVPPQPYTVVVEADGFLESRVDEIDPAVRPRLDVTLQAGLSLVGRVVNEQGVPVESFAVRARRIRGFPQPGEEGRDSEIRAALEGMGLEGLDVRAVRSQIESARGQLEAVRGQQRNVSFDPSMFGGGRTFRGEPEPHPGGRFRLEGLEDEGVYVVEVYHPDYLPTRSDEVEVRAMGGAPEVLVSLSAGLRAAGVVVGPDGRPVGGAKVELRVAQEANDADPRMRIARQFMNRPVGDAVADAAGRFSIGPVDAGRYELRATAEGFARTDGDPFELAVTREDLELVLDSNGRLTGQVLGVPADRFADVRVYASPISGAGRMNIGAGLKVDEEGRFETSVTPGDYVVRATLQGDERSLQREAMAMFTGGEIVADVTVTPGRDAVFNPTLRMSAEGTVVGSVTVNGRAIAGYTVRAPAPAGTDEGNPMARFMGMRNSARTGADGTFRIARVDQGPRQLEVRSPAGLTVYSAPIVVPLDGEVRHDVRLVLSDVRIDLEGVDAGSRAQVRMTRAGSEDSVRINLSRSPTAEGLPSGRWDYQLIVSGRETVEGTIDVQGDEVRVTLQAGPPKADGG